MKIGTIQFVIDVTKGEIPFRQYVTSKPVLNHMFILASKFTKENKINYHLYKVGSSGADLVKDEIVSFDEFNTFVDVFRKKVKQQNPDADLIEPSMEEGVLAISNHGVVSAKEANEIINLFTGSSSKADLLLHKIRQTMEKGEQPTPEFAQEILLTFMELDRSDKEKVVNEMGKLLEKHFGKPSSIFDEFNDLFNGISKRLNKFL
jgi:hypothetical protein